MGERVGGITTDHEKIRKWTEEREGSLEAISREQFFEEFEKRKPALLYGGKTSRGEISRFNRIISREESPKRKRH